jgi:hypothetical protein
MAPGKTDGQYHPGSGFRLSEYCPSVQANGLGISPSIGEDGFASNQSCRLNDKLLLVEDVKVFGWSFSARGYRVLL